jgi:transcription antitermination factor NusG
VLAPTPDLAVGDAVRITEGAFSGYVGVLAEERGALRLVVSVSILRKSVAVEFPRDFVAAARSAQTDRSVVEHRRATGLTV